MKKQLQGFIAGILSGIVAAGTIGVFAAYYTAEDNPFPITYNGNQVSLQGYNIEGSTYFKLRDIADVVGGFNVGFENSTIVLTGNPSFAGDAKTDDKQNTINNKSNIKYNTSFKLDKYYSTGRWWRTTDVESFQITNTETSVLGDLKISYEIIGVVTGDNYCSINVKCYDKDGFVIDSGIIFEGVTEGQKFKLKDTMYISPETVKLEFFDD